MPGTSSPGGSRSCSASGPSERGLGCRSPATEAVVTELGDEVAPYVAGRGTLRFTAARPLPLDLIRRIVEIRVRENEAAAR